MKSNLIDQIYYINLNCSSDRRKHMENILRRTAPCTSWRRWNAYMPTHAEMQTVLERFPREAQTQRNRVVGLTGDRVSHVSLLRHLQSIGKAGKRYLVLEDDVEFPAVHELDQVVRQRAPADWDVLRFSCWGRAFTYPPMLKSVSPSGNVFKVSIEAMTTCLREEKREADGGRRCWFCGGAHATLYRYEALVPERLRASRTRTLAISEHSSPVQIHIG
jgi:hypothetical protein